MHRDIKSMPRTLCKLRLFLATVLLAINTDSVWAEQGSFAQRHACKPDVFRLCSEFIPDHTAITNCLKQNITRLGPACRAVFEGKLK